uniref:Uncharacterized protein n=1 Tax=Oryza meridionalis TaxID=40149 RepID=A0A0E0DKQ0_9ORYZ
MNMSVRLDDGRAKVMIDTWMKGSGRGGGGEDDGDGEIAGGAESASLLVFMYDCLIQQSIKVKLLSVCAHIYHINMSGNRGKRQRRNQRRARFEEALA